jgi:hypothetical protein
MVRAPGAPRPIGFTTPPHVPRRGPQKNIAAAMVNALPPR